MKNPKASTGHCCLFFNRLVESHISHLLMILFVAFFIAFAGSNQAQAQNDLCIDAIPVVCGDVVPGSTIGATLEIEGIDVPFCSQSVTAPGVWYSFLGTGDLVNASLCAGPIYDSKLSVYTGSCGALLCEIDNDDACAPLSEVDFASTAGVTYYILVHGFGTNEGDFELSLTCTPNITPPNDECIDAIPIACGDAIPGSTVAGTVDPVGFCGTSASAAGVWYSFLGAGDDVTFSTCNAADFDTKISVFTDGCGTLTCVDGNDDAAGCTGNTSEITITANAGQQYLVYVHGFSSQQGTFTLSALCGAGGNNDNCGSAIEVACGDVVSGTTIGATADDLDVPICATSVTAPGVWYFYQGTGDLVTASLCGGATYDSKISIYDGACGALACVIDNDDACGTQSEVDFIANPGVTYYILVHGFGANEGDFDLSLSCTPIVLANDDCIDAEVITDGSGQPFLNFGATTDGLPDVLCDNFGNDQIFSDIWYSYTATCDGMASFSTDGGTTYDTRVAVYESPCGGKHYCMQR